MARTCKMCSQPIRGAAFEVAASAVVGNYAATWKVCRSCFDLVAAEESDDEYDADGPDLDEADPQMPGWVP